MTKATYKGPKWFVINAVDRFTSYSMKYERGEEFSSLSAARKRAEQLAAESPHTAFYLARVTKLVVVETKPVEIRQVG